MLLSVTQKQEKKFRSTARFSNFREKRKNMHCTINTSQDHPNELQHTKQKLPGENKKFIEIWQTKS